MRSRSPLVLLLAALVAAPVACSKDDKKPESKTEATEDKKASKKGDDGDDDDAKKAKKKKSKKDDGDKGDEKGDEQGAKKDDGEDDPSAVPGPRSKAPSKAELDAAPDLAVDGAKDLGCETRMVREWLQIACRGSGAKAPTFVEVTKGKTKDTLVATIPGSSMSVKTPYEPGVELEATFYWGDKAKKLVLAKWPLKKKRPDPIGSLNDATGKGLTPEMAAAKAYCACKVSTGGLKCDADFDGGSVDCFRTYWADCSKLVQCTNGEPGVWPTCLPGFVNAGIGGGCAKDCAKDPKCPAGTKCEDAPTGKKACM
jgi:hypothetical protein